MFVVDREAYDAAVSLSHAYGLGAVIEAGHRIETSRRRGNPVTFARWSRVRRTLLLLAETAAPVRLN